MKNHPIQLELHDHIMRSATSVTVKQTAKDYYNDKPCYRSQHYQNQLPCGVFGLVRRSRLGCRGHVNFTEHTLPADLTALCTYASSSVTDMGNTCRITNVRTQSPKISSLASIGACPVNAFTMTTVFPAGFVTFTTGQISVTLCAMSSRFVTYHAVFNTRCITEASIEVRAAFVSSAFSADAVTISEVTSGTFLITLLPIPTRLAFNAPPRHIATACVPTGGYTGT